MYTFLEEDWILAWVQPFIAEMNLQTSLLFAV